MRALFDVNVLIALLDADHTGHQAATVWFSQNEQHGWASCPITENGTTRIMSTPAYPKPLPIAAVLQRLALAKAEGNHRFWADDLSLTDTTVFNHEELLGPKQVTDRYLLAVAVKHGGRFVTFDRAIRPTAVVGATTNHLVQVLE